MPQVINGTDGNDTLSGAPGDTLVGGRGDDVFIVYDPSTLAQDYFQAGYDQLYTFVSYDLKNASIELLSAATHADTTPISLTGNGVQQAIIGNYGDNRIVSGGGTAVLTGLRGDDTYYVSAGNSVVENVGEGTDTVYTSSSYVLGDGASIERLAVNPGISGLDVNLTGNAFAQTLIGSDGVNILDGGGGADTLIGLEGNDVYRVYGPGETIVEAVGQGNDTVFTSGNFYLGAGISIETISAADQGLASSIYLLGNERDQRMIGDHGNNTLNGGGSRGGDTLIGLAGDDVYRIFGQNDSIVESRGQGNDIVYTSGNYRLAADVEVETLSTHQHSATLAMNLVGNALNNTIIGNYGVNVLDGGGGSDTLIGLDDGDVFRFTAAPAQGGVTTIRDYGVGNDVILLDSRAFTALSDGTLPATALAYGAAAADADDRIVYNAATGALSYDADGNGAGAAIHFAQLATGVAASDLRIVVATVPQDQLTTNTPGTYLIGDAVGTGTVIPAAVTSVTFNPYGIGYYFDLVFGASTSNGAVPSIKVNDPYQSVRLDFSQLRQGIVARTDDGFSTAAGQLLMAEPSASSAGAPSAVIGTAFGDVIDRNLGSASGGGGNDFIRGARSADGGAGDDHLVANLSTALTGGSGSDLFDLPIRTRQPGTNTGSAFNTVTDFNPNEDSINLVINYQGGLIPIDLAPGALSADQFHIGSRPTSAAHRFNYNADNGELTFWVRGNDVLPSGEIVLFAKLPTHLDLSADNFMLVPA